MEATLLGPSYPELMRSRVTLPFAAVVIASLAALAATVARDPTAEATQRSASPPVAGVPGEADQQARRRQTIVRVTPRAGDYIKGDVTGPDVEHLRVRYGPFLIGPGQNPNLYDGNVAALPKAGYITRFEPNLELADGSIPSANILHLHHGVWLVNGSPMWFADAEKSVFVAPRGYGWATKPSDRWVLNHMLHDLVPARAKAYLSWDVDFVPSDSPTGRKLRSVTTLWTDVRGGETYPVFDVPFKGGTSGRYVYPKMEPRAYASDDPRPYQGASDHNRVMIPSDGTLVAAVGHLHPGGLENTISLTRAGHTVVIQRGRAHYFDSAGPTSWDMAMGVTKPDWRIRVRRGDVLGIQTTYDTSHGAWFEAMGLAVVAYAPGDSHGIDPFAHAVDLSTRLTHGRLKENIAAGGAPVPGVLDPRKRKNGPVYDPWDGRAIKIENFATEQGDLSASGARGNPPLIAQGSSLSFLNVDAAHNIFHTLTACRAPCTGTPGTGFPLADSTPIFDSGELGFGIPGVTAATDSAEWHSPITLKPGTYSFYCRVHPFMRGAFRVVERATVDRIDPKLGG